MQGLSSIVAIAAARYHNLALKSDGTVWAWGRQFIMANSAMEDSRQTMDGIMVIFRSRQVQGLGSVVAIAAGNDHSLALKSDGTVWAWGNNWYGQLGVGSTTSTSTTPVQVQGLSSVVAIAAGGYHNVVVKSDGTVWQWGTNHNGQIV